MAAELDLSQVQSGDSGALSFDTLTRLSLVLGIYKALQVLYPEPAFADRWIGVPNSHTLFGDARRSPS